MTAKVCQAVEIPVKIKLMLKKLLPLVLFILIPLLLLYSDDVLSLIGRAASVPANIAIDVKNTDGDIKNSWANFAQGGEEPPPMFDNVTGLMKPLSPRYIRIDHIYDRYRVVKKTAQGLVFDFTLLDETVDRILEMGAKPFFSLSYMPAEFTATGSVIDKPSDWLLWENLVKETVLHYSGKDFRNLAGVYYEVWNEPELPGFGKFTPAGSKSYADLYISAARGAAAVSGANPFYFGGPAVGSYYPKWIEAMAKIASEGKARLDFYSFHRYHQDPLVFRRDLEKTREILSLYPNLSSLPLVISEWGIDSEKNEMSQGNKAAAHAAAVVAQLGNRAEAVFNFEVKDGPPPDGGKWGLITHEKSTNPLEVKSRYRVFMTLSRISGRKLKIAGEGTFVKAMAAKKDNGDIGILLVNYDLAEKNLENVPVILSGLEPGYYRLKAKDVLRDTDANSLITSLDGTISKNFVLLPDAVVHISLSRISGLAQFIQGVEGGADLALSFLGQTEPLVLLLPGMEAAETQLDFWLKPLWPDDDKPVLLLELEFTQGENPPVKISLEKRTSKTIDFLTMSVYDGQKTEILAREIMGWKNQSDWHRVTLRRSYDKFSLSVDGNLSEKSLDPSLALGSASRLSVFPFPGAIDNLSIIYDGKPVVTRSFNGAVTL
ncbi:MAG: hypothetical protein UV73_C0003G0177 [Candidatus Gottesmanbacteria bacterium GW2011_GWA2_43_14]|uniref:Glycosyl hydrolases family 39 N-terminal catalytic domain-containing protein n=1 Tax=Candidatus Gottesmanbacteria bacterium GW2011_GWA2_43_14 TaxID=1618443 RepID=A0A0G1DK65_9BACT|nr:MAG: hypothetical protein UV73_C0003G0177 [Candidatus Gottesmanbacteria bacterium GW2011_GWA2_43_14]